MKDIFINLTNHPSERWSEEQTREAEKYGSITDLEFPQIPATADEAFVTKLAAQYYCRIRDIGMALSGPAWSEHTTVLIQGEFTFTYILTRRLREDGVRVLSACSERVVEEHSDADGAVVKKVLFRFAGFRSYA